MAKATKEKRNGRPPKYESDELLIAKAQEYFALCDKNRQLPEKAGLCLALGISRETYSQYKNDRFPRLLRTGGANPSQLSMKCSKCGNTIERINSWQKKPVCYDCTKARVKANSIKNTEKRKAEREWRKEISKIHAKKGLPPPRFSAQQSSKS